VRLHRRRLLHASPQENERDHRQYSGDRQQDFLVLSENGEGAGHAASLDGKKQRR
jgi:hypothetical protein